MPNTIRDYARSIADIGISLDQIGTVVEELVRAMAEINGYEKVTTGELFGPTTMAYFREGWIDTDTRSIITIGEASTFKYYTGFEYIVAETITLGNVNIYEQCERVDEAIDRSSEG